MPETIDSVKKNLRSVLISSKDGVRATKLQGEYRELAGSYIPHSKFGFHSLDEFLSTLKDVVRLGYSRTGELTYYAIADLSTQHIQAMVAKQRGKKTSQKKVSRSSYHRNKATRSHHKAPFVHSPMRYHNLSVKINSFGSGSGSSTRKIMYSRTSPHKFIPNWIAGGDARPNGSRNDHSHQVAIAPRFEKLYKKQAESSSVDKFKNPLGSAIAVVSETTSAAGDSVRSSSSENTLPSPNDKSASPISEKRLKINLHKLLEVNPNGLHSTNVCALYKEIFSEEFPAILVEKIISKNVSGFAQVDKIAVGSGFKYILFPIDEGKAKKELTAKFPTPRATEKPPTDVTVATHTLLALGEEHKVKVQSVVSCDEIYVILVAEEQKMAAMHKELKQQLKKPWPCHFNLIKPGSYVISKLSIRVGARAKVKSVTSEHAEIFDIDFGDTFWVVISDLQLMPASLAKNPEFLIRCSMHRSNDPNGKWFDATAVKFYDSYAHANLMMKTIAISTTHSVNMHSPEHKHSVFFYHNSFNINFRLFSEEEEQILKNKANSYNPFEFQPPGCVKLPSEEYCDLYVFNASCTTEIEACIIGEGYSDELVELETKMQSFYSKTNQNWILSNPPPLDCVYAVLSEDTCIRGKLISIDGDQANVYFVDNGELETVNLSDLRPLTREFAAFPMQVVTVSLAGLDHPILSTHSDVLQKLNDVVVYKSCTAHVVARFLVDSARPTYIVELIDTAGPAYLNINDICLNMVYDDDLLPTLPDVGSESLVSISHIDPDSEKVFIRTAGEGMQTLNQCCAEVEKQLQGQKMLPSQCARNLYPGKHCLVQAGGSFHRVRIIEIADGKPCGITVFFIDIGKQERVTRGRLFKIKMETLFYIPPQAVCCRLSGNTSASSTSVLLMDVTLDIKSTVLVRLDKLSDSDQPHLISMWTDETKQTVVVSKQAPPNPSLMSSGAPGNDLPETSLPLAVFRSDSLQQDVNNSNGKSKKTATDEMIVMAQCQNSNKSENNFTEADIDDLSSITSPSPVPLPMTSALFHPSTKFSDTLFPVVVEEVINPCHMQLIAMKNIESRNILSRTLISFYEQNPHKNLPSSMIDVGENYALSFAKQFWHRVQIRGKLGNTISVYFIDFGACVQSVFDLKKVRLCKLVTPFSTIPGLAVTAKLAGIMPLDKNNLAWPDSVSKRLSSLIKGKCFVAHVLKVTGEKSLHGRYIYHVCLCNTRATPEVWINDLLVDKWRCANYM
ncbi:tudor domain-containing protein 7-like [Clavelina lepadiformis]|uniref:Tudor domain-containing protein 7 n=1 Tax=Clavelina lepadiformis TaxID=159417 RepID=A0ABP0F4R7_CLALP